MSVIIKPQKDSRNITVRKSMNGGASLELDGSLPRLLSPYQAFVLGAALFKAIGLPVEYEYDGPS